MQIALLVREVNHRFPYRKSAFGRWIRIVELEITREACIYTCVCVMNFNRNIGRLEKKKDLVSFNNNL